MLQTANRICCEVVVFMSSRHGPADYETNLAAKEEIEMLMETIAELELRKIDKIMKHFSCITVING